jgi:low temperature requirement protein LtrA
MDAEEIRKIVREELKTAPKNDKVAGLFYAFAIWVGTVTLASFLLTWWAVRQDLPQNTVDWTTLFIVIGSAIMVALVLWIQARSTRTGPRQK